MYKCRDYIFPKTLDEAYELNQKRNNVITAGNGWLRLSSRQYGTIIDISELGLEGINEYDDCFTIGAMTSLRELEQNVSINSYTNGAVRESLRHIVGVQFRNSATLGGSIYGRFGFSDVLTMFLVLDTYAELFKGGSIPLEDFAKMKYDSDILTGLKVTKKRGLKAAYSSFRNQYSDFPVLTCAISVCGNKVKTAIGARPARAAVTEGELYGDIEDFAHKTALGFTYGSNIRASAKYREHIAYVLIKNTLQKLKKEP